MNKTTEKESIDPRVRHAGKAGKHHSRTINVRKGRTRRDRRQTAKANRWRTE